MIKQITGLYTDENDLEPLLNDPGVISKDPDTDPWAVLKMRQSRSATLVRLSCTQANFG